MVDKAAFEREIQSLLKESPKNTFPITYQALAIPVIHRVHSQTNCVVQARADVTTQTVK